jgi:uncharacterized protein involved in exopolysaccharide biosynthesis
MDSSSALRAIGRGWYFLAVGAIAGAVAAVLLTARQQPVYEAASTYIVSPRVDGTTDAAESVRTLDGDRARAIVSTLVEVMTSSTVQQEAAATIGMEAATLADYSVQAVVLPEAYVAELTVVGPVAQNAVLLSAAVGNLAAARFVDLYQIYDVGLLDPADLPTGPVNRGLIETAVMAGALGLLAGAVVALIAAAPRIRRSNMMQRRLASYGGEATVTLLPTERREAG